MWKRLLQCPDTATLALGLLVAVGICWPFIGGRPVFLLDWVLGPRPPIIGTAVLGLQGGLTTGVPVGVVAAAVIHVVGEAFTWLVLFACFPVAAVSVGRLTGSSTRARVAAAALYCVNPWVLDRAYVGHLPLLLGYALLPLAVRSALSASRLGISVGMLGPALWWAVLTALSPHFAWIFGLVLVAVVLVARPQSRRAGARLLGWLAANALVFTLMSLYIVLPHLTTRLPTTFGPADLRLYRTTADPHLGLLPNVAALYGFWRQGPHPILPKTVISGWPLLSLAVVVLVAAGFISALRRHPDEASQALGRRRLAWVLVVAGGAGFFLALGSQGPTGWLFTAMYDHVPFFAVMREPQKFLMLVALAYAVGLGWAVENISAPAGSAARRLALAGVFGVVLPLGSTPTIFNGMDATVAPSTIPSAYQWADNLMGDGPGRILYLPWHLYEVQPFTGGRVVANLGPSVFRRTVLSGDNVEAGGIETQSTSPRSASIERLLAHGTSRRHVGAQLAPLGVRYVVLAKTADWRLYRWLDHQPDLRLVLDTASLQVWRNTAYRGAGQAPGPTPGTSVAVRQLSLTAYQVPPGRPGLVAIDAAYQPGWELDGRPGRAGPQGTVVFRSTGAGGVATFAPWSLARVGYGLSGGVAVVLLAALSCSSWARRRRGNTANFASPPAEDDIGGD